jgi:hypothetical protein
MALRHISGWVDVSGPDGPIDPGYGQRPPVDWSGRPDNELPGSGGHPWLPGHGGGGRPDNDLPSGGHIWSTLIRWLTRPVIGGGPVKPPGLWPILPVDPGWGIDPPDGPPSGPGDWVPIDPGFGKPPIWGFLPVDPGWGVGKLPVVDNTLPGHWVPVDPGFGRPGGGCGGEKPAHIWGKPLWAYIFEIGPDFGKPIEGKPEPK